jgi:hypothetical protein
MTGSTRRVVSGAALGLGTIALAALLWAILDLARIQQSHSGEEFKRSANLLRFIVLAEILAVALGSGLIVWRSRSPTARLVTIAVVVWALSLFDFALLAIAGSVPR